MHAHANHAIAVLEAANEAALAAGHGPSHMVAAYKAKQAAKRKLAPSCADGKAGNGPATPPKPKKQRIRDNSDEWIQLDGESLDHDHANHDVHACTGRRCRHCEVDCKILDRVRHQMHLERQVGGERVAGSGREGSGSSPLYEWGVCGEHAASGAPFSPTRRRLLASINTSHRPCRATVSTRGLADCLTSATGRRRAAPSRPAGGRHSWNGCCRSHRPARPIT